MIERLSIRLVGSLASIALAAGCAQSPTGQTADSLPPNKSDSLPPSLLLPQSAMPKPSETLVLPPAGKPFAFSRQNRPLVTRIFNGPGADATHGQVVLLLAGIHGNEPTGVFAAQRLIELLDKSASTIVPAGVRLVIVPLANPDGYAAHRRQNASDVDLNRNFPAKSWVSTPKGDYWNGPSPLSEPESRAIHDLILSIKPIRILSLHSIRPPKHGNNFDGPAEPLARLLASKNGYAVLPTMGYATPGSLGSWAGIDLGIPIITLEFPSTTSGPAAWAANREALFAFIRGS